MYENILPEKSKNLLAALNCESAPELNGWVLAEGTGLALQLGHRQSEDFDFFRTDDMDVRELHTVLSRIGRYETLVDIDHSLNVIMQKVKLSFFRIREPFLHEPIPWMFAGIADYRDIALMKLLAISNRGSRKDFIDLYMLLTGGLKLTTLMDEFALKYGEDRMNYYHVLKSLTWFEDAEKEPMPRMLTKFSWKRCRAYFEEQARRITLP